MLARDHLNAGPDEVHVRVARGQLLFQPLPLFRTQHVGGSAGFFSMVAAIEQNDFHSSSRRTKGVARKHARLFSARAFRRFIEEIEQEPLALDFVPVFLPAVAYAIIVIIPGTQDATLFAERFVIGLAFLRSISSRQISQIIRAAIDNVAEPD